MTLTGEQMVEMILDFSAGLDKVQAVLEDALAREATCRSAFIQARAKAWHSVEGRNREEREAYVDEATVHERFELDCAVGDAKGGMEAVRNKRQQLSSLQTASNSLREEMAFARVGPDVTAGETPGERFSRQVKNALQERGTARRA